MVYVALIGGRPRLFLRTIDRDAPELIDGSDGAADPFFSPDGEWIGFFAHGSLKKLRIDGGTPVVLCAARAGAGASWARDGTIVFGGGPGGGLGARVGTDGGEPVVLDRAGRRLARGHATAGPTSCPTAARCSTRRSAWPAAASRIFDIAQRREHTARRVRRVRPLLAHRSPRVRAARAARGGAVLAARRAASTAAPRPILRGLATSGADARRPALRLLATRARCIYVPGASADVDEQLHWLDVRGQLEPVPLPPAPLGAVDVAPNLQQLAMTVETEGGTDLWVGDLQRGAREPSSADGRSASPTWRPDGLEIAFAYSKAGPFNLFVRPADSDAAPQPLLREPVEPVPDVVVARRPPARVHRVPPADRRRHLGARRRHARTPARGAHAVRRIARALLARRPLDRLHVERVGALGRVRPARERQRSARAGLDRRRRVAVLVG